MGCAEESAPTVFRLFLPRLTGPGLSLRTTGACLIPGLATACRRTSGTVPRGSVGGVPPACPYQGGERPRHWFSDGVLQTPRVGRRDRAEGMGSLVPSGIHHSPAAHGVGWGAVEAGDGPGQQVSPTRLWFHCHRTVKRLRSRRQPGSRERCSGLNCAGNGWVCPAHWARAHWGTGPNQPADVVSGRQIRSW